MIGSALGEGARREGKREGGSAVSGKKAARISLCMIVKDEESVLARCLDSAKGYVDEIIVVDTGSTDRSIDIAREFGATVTFASGKKLKLALD